MGYEFNKEFASKLIGWVHRLLFKDICPFLIQLFEDWQVVPSTYIWAVENQALCDGQELQRTGCDLKGLGCAI